MYSFLIDNIEQKEQKAVATISHNEYKDLLLNNKCIRDSMNRIPSKGHRTGKYQIKEISLSCFGDKVYI